jgi:hypothetical protein
MTRRRAEGIPNFRQDQQKAMATRHGHDRQGGHMAGKETGLKVFDNGDVVDLATGEVVERRGSAAEPEEIEARELANQEAKAYPEMLDALNHKPIPWRSQEGDVLIGTVVDRYEREGIMKNDGTIPLYPVVEVRIGSGDILAFHAFHTAAQSQIEKRNPQPGDFIAVRRLGEVPSQTKGRQPYTDYAITVRKHVPDGVMTPTGNSRGDWNRPVRTTRSGETPLG